MYIHVHHMNMNLLYRSLRRGTQLTRGFPEEHNGEKLCKDSQERCFGVVYILKLQFLKSGWGLEIVGFEKYNLRCNLYTLE